MIIRVILSLHPFIQWLLIIMALNKWMYNQSSKFSLGYDRCGHIIMIGALRCLASNYNVIRSQSHLIAICDFPYWLPTSKINGGIIRGITSCSGKSFLLSLWPAALLCMASTSAPRPSPNYMQFFCCLCQLSLGFPHNPLHPCIPSMEILPFLHNAVCLWVMMATRNA